MEYINKALDQTYVCLSVCKFTDTLWAQPDHHQSTHGLSPNQEPKPSDVEGPDCALEGSSTLSIATVAIYIALFRRLRLCIIVHQTPSPHHPDPCLVH